jgi:hypothetical protein
LLVNFAAMDAGKEHFELEFNGFDDQRAGIVSAGPGVLQDQFPG